MVVQRRRAVATLVARQSKTHADWVEVRRLARPPLGHHVALPGPREPNEAEVEKTEEAEAVVAVPVAISWSRSTF